MQKKLSKIENDKKMEYEYLTDNIKSNLKRSEKENYDMKNKIIQLENQINLHDTKSENYTKEINKLTYNLNEKNIEVDNLRNQIKSYELQIKQEEETNKTLNARIKELKEKSENNSPSNIINLLHLFTSIVSEVCKILEKC